MKIDVKNMKGEVVSEVELPDSIFAAPIYVDLMHQAYVRQMANARLGTHETKTRHQVAGGGRKPYKQKGTGRARQGSIRAVQWKGGGRVHTPHMRDYTQDMPKKMRRAALRSALSVKAGDSEIIVIDDLKLDEPKTRLMVAALNALVGENTALILIPDKESNEEVIRATNNIPYAKVLLANYLNIRDLLRFDKVVMPVAAIETINAYLG
ncbi:MAG: 50S ribosomal protein L4 [Chloroflexi bacterium]|nr:50S ribosomal protein L4 [Chloroflexota bacterium]